VYHEGAEVGYHEHRSGYETFFLPRGKVECVVRGRKFIMEAGDILHLQPYIGHGFKHLEEGSVWRELFHDIYMADGIRNKNFVAQHFPTRMADDPGFARHYRAGGDAIPREPAEPRETVDRKDVWELRTPEFSHATYKFPGVEMRLKVGRWECNGVKEVWHYKLSKGFAVEWGDPFRHFQTLYVCKGRVKVDVMGEAFEACEDCLVHIPPYHTHALSVLEDGAEIYDMNCETLMLSMLEDLDSIRARSPEKLADKAFMYEFLHGHECYHTFAGLR